MSSLLATRVHLMHSMGVLDRLLMAMKHRRRCHMFTRGAVHGRLFPEGERMNGVSCVEGLKHHLWGDDVIEQSLIFDTVLACFIGHT